MDAQNKIQEAFTSTATKLARVQGEMHEILTRDHSKFTADENKAETKRYIELRGLATDYEIEITQEKHKAETQRTKIAQTESTKRISIAKEEAIEMIRATAEGLKNFAPAASDSAKWMDAFGRNVEEVTFDLNNLAPAQDTVIAKFQGMQGPLETTEFKVNKLAIAFLKLAGTLFTFANGLSDIGGALGGKVGGIISSLGDMFVGAGQFAVGFAEFAVNPIQGIMDMAAGAIKAVKGLFNALKELFGHDWTKDTHKQLNILIGDLEISEDLFQRIAEDAEQMGNAMRASLLHLPEIFDELGVSLDNFFQLADSAQDVLSGVEQGILSTAEASEILNDILPQLFDVAIEGGDAYLDRLEQILIMTKAAGIDISSVTDILISKIKELKDQLIGVSTDLMQNLVPAIEAIRNEAQAEGIAAIILQNVQALQQVGVSTAQILEIIAPSIDALRTKLKEMGLTLADVGLGFLGQMENISKKFPEQISQINMVTNSLKLMRQLGIKPNQAAFNAMQNAFLDAVKDISNGSKVSKAQLELIRPTLIQLASDALDYGLKLSPATIELLKQAGLWDDIAGKPDATKVQKAGIEDLLDALTKEPNGLIPTLQRFIDMLATLNGLTVETTINTNYTASGEPPNGLQQGRTQQGRSRQGLKGWEQVTAPSWYFLHPKEVIGGADVAPQVINSSGSARNEDHIEIKIIAAPGMNERAVGEAVVAAYIREKRPGGRLYGSK
ncbi:hypothetical protein L0152_07210 [bacterium]|nr:hypothetical protein [bacterium]